MANAPVILITMPWDSLVLPSIQIGTLRAVLAREGLATEARSFNLSMAEHMARAGFSVTDYERVNDEFWRRGLGDWLFGVPPFRETTSERDAAYREFLCAGSADRAYLERMLGVRKLVPSYLEACARDVLRAEPKVVGFSSSFSQNVSSLALSRLLKEYAPHLKVVFGGANCDGPMGMALFQSFPWVDAVVQGEGERVLPLLVRDWLSGDAVREQPGLCFRDQQGEHVSQQPAVRVPMDEVPPPDYDEYFERLEASPLREEIQPRVRLLFESARGCWWGEKSHCTFCGLNGSSMKFRSKSPEHAFEQMLRLARKHQQLHLQAVDNIIEMGYFQSFLPWLRESGFDITVFFETKSNLKKSQVQLLSEAGVRNIQPGIESLSTPILQLMKKGVTALQNVRLLKWCQQFGVHPYWNLIYGFPREPLAEYDRMAELVPSLLHLASPTLTRLDLQRFSPYHVRAEELGIRLEGPATFYAHIYPLEEKQLSNLAYSFEFSYLDGAPDPARFERIRESVGRWQEKAQETPVLEYRCGPGFMKIMDLRETKFLHVLNEREARIYLACDAGATVHQVARAMRDAGDEDLREEEIRDFLEELLANRLLFREGDLYLSLALPLRREQTAQERSLSDESAVAFAGP
jgi:ribosomal peptide maturation radical SAM protein 1